MPKKLWEYLLEVAKNSSFEIHTIPQNRRTPLWFHVDAKKDYLIIRNAQLNVPSVNLSKDRRIDYKDFELVFGYYERGLKGESGVRLEASKKSQNTAYIFALITEAAKQTHLYSANY